MAVSWATKLSQVGSHVASKLPLRQSEESSQNSAPRRRGSAFQRAAKLQIELESMAEHLREGLVDADAAWLMAFITKHQRYVELCSRNDTAGDVGDTQELLMYVMIHPKIQAVLENESCDADGDVSSEPSPQRERIRSQCEAIRRISVDHKDGAAMAEAVTRIRKSEPQIFCMFDSDDEEDGSRDGANGEDPQQGDDAALAPLVSLEDFIADANTGLGNEEPEGDSSLSQLGLDAAGYATRGANASRDDALVDVADRGKDADREADVDDFGEEGEDTEAGSPNGARGHAERKGRSESGECSPVERRSSLHKKLAIQRGRTYDIDGLEQRPARTTPSACKRTSMMEKLDIQRERLEAGYAPPEPPEWPQRQTTPERTRTTSLHHKLAVQKARLDSSDANDIAQCED